MDVVFGSARGTYLLKVWSNCLPPPLADMTAEDLTMSLKYKQTLAVMGVSLLLFLDLDCFGKIWKILT